jgi:DNA-binding GntR family transcriptional regulator
MSTPDTDLTTVAGSQEHAADGTRVQSLQNAVRQRILSGVYRPGEWIREAELRKEFGLSNGPVREALQATVADGLAERAAFRGVRVIDLSPREIVELFELRYALLGCAVELAAARTNAEVRRSATVLKKELRKATSKAYVAGTWFGGTLSHWVFELADNSRLKEAYERTLLQSLLYVSLARERDGDNDRLLTQAYVIIDAVAQGEGAKAREAVAKMTAQTLHYLEFDRTWRLR